MNKLVFKVMFVTEVLQLKHVLMPNLFVVTPFRSPVKATRCAQRLNGSFKQHTAEFKTKVLQFYSVTGPVRREKIYERFHRPK